VLASLDCKKLSLYVLYMLSLHSCSKGRYLSPEASEHGTKLGKEKTVVSTHMHMQAAEQIVVLDNGRVAEIGSHKELTEKGGQYAKLVSTQSLSVSNV